MINWSERESMGAGFAKTEITSSTSGDTRTTTVYGGYAPSDNASDSDEGWSIQKTVIEDNGTTKIITEKWAVGSWTNRASLTYKYL